MDKLTGQAYIDHWRTRIAKGPLEAGTVENGNDTWGFIAPHLKADEPRSVLEYGCAYGRMLRHLQERWPKARLYGVDLSSEALAHLKANWVGRQPVVFNQNTPPLSIHVDMIFTCTVLQHVTDDDILRDIAAGFRRILNLGGFLCLFENIAHRPGKGGAHMREFAAQDYMNLWPEMEWEDCGTFVHHGEDHELMIGRKLQGCDL